MGTPEQDLQWYYDRREELDALVEQRNNFFSEFADGINVYTSVEAPDGIFDIPIENVKIIWDIETQRFLVVIDNNLDLNWKLMGIARKSFFASRKDYDG